MSGKALGDSVVPGAWRQANANRTVLVGLARQARVVRALVIREVKSRFARRYLGYMWLFLEPAVHLTILSFIFSFRGRTLGTNVDLVVFLFCGIVPMIAFRHVLQMTMQAVDVNRQLLNYPRVRPIDTMLARFILESAIFLIVFFSMMGVLAWMGYSISLARPMIVLVVAFSLVLAAFGLGMLFSIGSHYAQDFREVATAVTRILYVTSGVFFTAKDLPHEVQPIALLNPFLHAVDLTRYGLIRDFQTVASLKYCVTACVSIFLIGFIATFVFRSKYYHYYDR
jgi:capsular polysaccharide transport system permease protein